MKHMALMFASLVAASSALSQGLTDEHARKSMDNGLATGLSKAAKMALEAAAKAGNPAAPQPVEESAVPSFERLAERFKLGASQLKPEFVTNMKAPAELTHLAGLGCSAEVTLPSGTEFQPGRLDGTVTLFRCADGSYGTLEVTLAFSHPRKVKAFAKEALNDSIEGTPAVGRYRATPSGLIHSTLSWGEPQSKMFSMDFITQPGKDKAGRMTSSAAGLNASARAKRVAAVVGDIPTAEAASVK